MVSGHTGLYSFWFVLCTQISQSQVYFCEHVRVLECAFCLKLKSKVSYLTYCSASFIAIARKLFSLQFTSTRLSLGLGQPGKTDPNYSLLDAKMGMVKFEQNMGMEIFFAYIYCRCNYIPMPLMSTLKIHGTQFSKGGEEGGGGKCALSTQKICT